jgi:hypothetical protein
MHFLQIEGQRTAVLDVPAETFLAKADIKRRQAAVDIQHFRKGNAFRKRAEGIDPISEKGQILPGKGKGIAHGEQDFKGGQISAGHHVDLETKGETGGDQAEGTVAVDQDRCTCRNAKGCKI